MTTNDTPLSLVLVPGLLCDERLWAPQIDALSDMVNPIVVDVTQQTTIEEMAAEALSIAPGPLTIAGLSMGGYVAMQAVLMAPARVKALALLDTRAHPDTAEATAAREDLLRLSDYGRFMGVTPRLLPTLIHEARLRDKELTDLVQDMSRNVGRDGFQRQMRAIMNRADLRDELGSVSCPTLVLCGREDKRTPLADSEEIHELIPHSELVVVDECGHLATLEQPKAVNEAMRRWLEKVSADG